MAVGQETKRKIIELYFTQHKNIREIAKEVQKSSRDVVAMVKKHKQELQQSQPSMSAGDGVDQQIEEASIEPHVNVRAYELFTKGLTPLQVESELKLSEADTTNYYTEYLRLKRLPDLGYLLKRLRTPEKISAFIELTNLALDQHMRASQVVQLLKMANSPMHGMHNIEENIKKYRWVIAHLRETRQKQGKELFTLDNKIRSANEILKQLNLVIKMRNEELAAVLDKKIKYELMAEQFIVNNKTFTKIQTIAKDKVNAFLTEYKGRKLLEFSLAVVVEGLRQRHDYHRELLFKSMPPLKNYDYDPAKVFYLNEYDYSYSNVIEKVLGPASEIYDKLVKGLTDLTISTTAGLERYSYPKNTNFA
jgi:transposase-like protein